MKRFEDPEQVEVARGERFVVALSGNGVGGYLWHADELPDELRLVAERDVPPPSGAVGAAGTKEFELEATAPGTFTAGFELRREWEPAPQRVKTVTVRAAG
jgi:predicted secreted protein